MKRTNANQTLTARDIEILENTTAAGVAGAGLPLGTDGGFPYGIVLPPDEIVKPFDLGPELGPIGGPGGGFPFGIPRDDGGF